MRRSCSCSRWPEASRICRDQEGSLDGIRPVRYRGLPGTISAGFRVLGEVISMCGRYTLTTPAGRLGEEFRLDGTVGIPPSYNVAPTQQVAAVLEDEGGRRLEMLRWGLVPSWADDPG